MLLAGGAAGSYAGRTRRKLPDTWWGAIVVGVPAGAVGGVTAALMGGIWSSDSLVHRLFVFVPSRIAGVIVFCVLVQAQKTCAAPALTLDGRAYAGIREISDSGIPAISASSWSVIPAFSPRSRRWGRA